VRGVGHQLALGVARGLQRAQHRVEARGQPARLVIAPALEAMAQVAGRRDALGGRGQAPERTRGRA
jgi:hypothetical protein